MHHELGAQAPIARGSRVAIAYSGGKDSTVALHVMADLRAARADLELHAVTIDEGIQGYRPPALETTARVCRSLDIPHEVRRTQDLAGLDVDAFQRLGTEVGACSFCGVFRRRLMNDFAKEIGATHLVTGHNLDDTAQSVLMNLATDNLDKLTKLGPHETIREGLVPRLLPLRTIPEVEVYLYATVRGLEWHEGECPYSVGAARQVYRDVLYRMEEARPGTRHSLVKTHERLRPLLASSNGHEPMTACNECGEPTSGTRCKVCEFRGRFAPKA